MSTAPSSGLDKGLGNLISSPSMDHIVTIGENGEGGLAGGLVKKGREVVGSSRLGKGA